jgi:glycosyltransferase involved in cell wall biosynthesis
MPLVLETKKQCVLNIYGDGILYDKIKSIISDKRLYDKVYLCGSVLNSELSYYLNHLKLLVVPSFTEAGPRIAFEAMSCGTPVLKTPCGLASDVIHDGVNGFIMEDNSSNCVANNIIRLSIVLTLR